ncbi:MAG: helix-turn-helix transcriptional regulator [Vampirovibrionales bacterium]
MALRLRVAELAMARQGWTMRMVSERLDVDHQTVMYWNQGRAFPRLPMMLRLCALLGCKLDELVASDDPRCHPLVA